MQQVTNSEKKISLFLFSLNQETFALNMAELEALIPEGHLTLVPGAGPEVAGIIVYLGDIWTILKMGSLLSHLDLNTGKAQNRGQILILRIQGHKLGILVDQALRVTEVAESELEKLHPTDDWGEHLTYIKPGFSFLNKILNDRVHGE